MSKQAFPDTPEGMLELLGHLSDEELQELFEANKQLEAQIRVAGPKNDDELHAWLTLSLDRCPPCSVCEGHSAPSSSSLISTSSGLTRRSGVANRGGAKTFLVAVLHWLNSKFKPGCEYARSALSRNSLIAAYAHLKSWIYRRERKIASE